MIERYTRPAMGAVWSEQNKYQCWLEVELAAADALAELGAIPPAAAADLRRSAGFSLARIHEIEREVRHDVIAFTTAVAEEMKASGVTESSRWLHYGLTSNDVVDTAQALQLKGASKIISDGLAKLLGDLKESAFRYKHTLQIGRTHGIHAEPITFGLKVAIWYDEFRRHEVRFAAAAEEMRVGKISGAVGTFAHIGPEAEEKICARLGLKAAPVTSQVLSRDLHANYVAVLAGIAGSMDKIALEIRLLQRTEVREAEEPFSPGQKGSSAMPHKRNPVTCEQISGLARVVRANAQAALENVALWHERDISHSSAERIILPDSTTLVDYMLQKTANLVDTMFIYPKRMMKNLESTGGLVFSGQLLLDLVEAGVLREDAYRLVQSNAMRAWKEDLNFRELIMNDPEITAKVKRETLEHAFDLQRPLRNVDKIFKRVFGG